MIDIRDLSKTYSGNIHALKNVNLHLSGGIIGLVGQNGAGKTTLMRIIASLLNPTQGAVMVGGYSVQSESDRAKIRDMIGYLPQANGFYAELTVEQNLDYFALLKKMDDSLNRANMINAVLDAVRLESVRKRPVRTLSGGMKRRLGIAITLLNQPKILILDEPTVGLDPEERQRFRQLLSELGQGRLILLSSHILEDIQQIADKMVIIHQGAVIFDGDLPTLTQQMQATSIEDAYLQLLAVS
ncbi:MAG: ATP-binding cassette domain-containing protein [Anaerolineae bacterium]|jgi:ABC-type multidrug transport system ATPase subunit|nr:ATP-binding cassette domain-containing protein [Anaerolineae bacterium]